MRRFLRAIVIVGSVVATIALTGYASPGTPVRLANGLGRLLGAASSPLAAAGQGGQSQQTGRGNSPARDGQADQQNPPDSQNPPDGQNPPADQPPQAPLFRTGIDFVRVDVIVSDRSGNPL